MIKSLSILCFLLSLSILSSQTQDTELWLFNIGRSKSGIAFTKPINISNYKSYNNQPSFSSDGKKIYFSSVRDTKQADIYYYEIRSGKTIQFTKTPMSEFSPAETPDNKFISAVVVEADSTQCMHLINKITGLHEQRFTYDSVGYYQFLNNDTCIYYKLTQPHSIRYHVNSTNEDKWLGNAPARTFKAINRNTLIYGIKDSLKITYYIYKFLLHKGEKYAEYNSSNEEIAWQSGFGLVKSEGTTLIRFDEEKKTWILLIDLADYGFKKVTRFCFDVRGKYLVVTNNL